MRQKKSYTGSITVEAAVVIPMVIVVILSFLYFTLYLHDRVVMSCTLDEALLRVNQAINQPSNYITGEVHYEDLKKRSLLYSFEGDHSREELALKQYVKEQLETSFLISKLSTVEVKTGYSKRCVTAVAEVMFQPIPMFHFLTGHGVITQTIEIPTHHPSDFTRMWDNILDVAGGMKYYDKIVEVLQKISGR